jgi:plastocyanin domain-containing protein
VIWLINLTGFLLIAGIVWWFWLHKPAGVAIANEQPLIVTVADGVYQPAHIKVLAEQPVQMAFLRKDASPCAESVIFPDLDLSYELPVNQPVMINLPPLKPGQYEFHCQMKMYRGQLRVEAIA